MSCGWRSLLAVVLAAVVSRSTGTAQQTRELGAEVLLTTAGPALVAGGVYGAIRPSPRARIALAAVGGVADGEGAARAELMGHLLLAPSARARAGVYLGGGVAGVIGPRDRAYIVLLVGVEGRPASQAGWALEAGVGGGVRLALGWRQRWFRRASLGSH